MANSTAQRKSTRIGRPPAGLKGERTSRDYRQLTIRLPPETAHLLRLWSADTERPTWQVINDALLAQAPAELKRLAQRKGQKGKAG